MSQNPIKISFNAATLRVRASFVTGDTAVNADAPKDIVQRVKSKMDSELSTGKISGFNIYDSRFQQCWQALHKQVNSGAIPNDKMIELVLADAFPSCQGLMLSKESENTVMFQSQPGSERAKQWPFEYFNSWFYYRYMQLMPSGLLPHDGQLMALWARFKHTKKPFKAKIAAKPAHDPGKPFGVSFNRARCEVTIVVNDPSLFASQEQIAKIIERCLEGTKKIRESGVANLVLRKDQLIVAIRTARNGHESCGVWLPFTALVASSELPGDTAASNTQPSQKSALQEHDSQKQTAVEQTSGALPIIISEDKLEATVGQWDMSAYDDDELTLTQEWLRAEIKKAGIRFGIDEQSLTKIIERIGVKEDLSGMLIAQGERGEGGRDPYLHQVYKDIQEIAPTSESFDIRELQQRSIVKLGQLVAELRFRSQRQRGKNVFGEDVEPPADDELDIIAGEGIEKRGKYRYYAIFDGIPEIDDKSLSLSRILTHEGDVNLRSGNIRFEGNVEVKGSIDTGAVVEVKGDLIVHGSIRGAFVSVGGNLTVHAGITTGEGKGVVRVRSDVAADFIENSRLICGGNISIKRVMVNSKIVCGGYIHADTNHGVIAGGSISARQYVRAAKLGFSKGAKTVLKVGVDWRAELAVSIRQGRLDRLEGSLDEARQAMRELMRKSKAQTTRKHEQMIEDYRIFLQKGRSVGNRMKDHLDAAKKLVTYEPDARVYVHDVLSANVSLELCGTTIPLGSKDVAGVEVTPKKRRGSYISALEESDPKKSGSAA